MENFLFRLKLLKSFQILTIFVRYLLGIAFVWASILKIKGIRFEPQSGENTPIHSLPHLLEAMYRSGFYWYFIGWGQFIAGLLIMSQIFSTLGAIVYFPIMLTIFVLTTAFQGPVFLTMTSLMLLANIYLLLWDWNRLKFIILDKPGKYVDQSTEFSRQKIWVYIGILLCIVISIFRVISTRHIVHKEEVGKITIRYQPRFWQTNNAKQQFLTLTILQNQAAVPGRTFNEFPI